MTNWVSKWKVESSSKRGTYYTVSKSDTGEWGCSCPRWTNTRLDCRHIKETKAALLAESARSNQANVNRPQPPTSALKPAIPASRPLPAGAAERVYSIPSKSRTAKAYTVRLSAVGWRCECKGYREFTACCDHITAAMQLYQAEHEAADLAALAQPQTRTAGGREIGLLDVKATGQARRVRREI